MTRSDQKKEYQSYQDAARKLCEALPGVTVSNHPTAHVTADRDGAFVDVVIWVGKRETEK